MTEPEVAAIAAALQQLTQACAAHGGFDDDEISVGPPISEDELAAFEAKHRILLPAGYRNFLARLGLVTVPGASLVPLAQWSGWLRIEDQDHLARVFPQQQALLRGTIPDDDFFAARQVAGSLRLHHDGCDSWYILIVSGALAGAVWYDQRADGGPLEPAHVFPGKSASGFLDWYLQRLTQVRSQIEALSHTRHTSLP